MTRSQQARGAGSISSTSRSTSNEAPSGGGGGGDNRAGGDMTARQGTATKRTWPSMAGPHDQAHQQWPLTSTSQRPRPALMDHEASVLLLAAQAFQQEIHVLIQQGIFCPQRAIAAL